MDFMAVSSFCPVIFANSNPLSYKFSIQSSPLHLEIEIIRRTKATSSASETFAATME